MKSQLLLTLPLLLLSTSAFAQTVSEGEALDKALNFLQSSQSRRARGQQSSPQLTLTHKAEKDGETYYYIFNDQQTGSFVIVAGDERATEILGYGDHGCLDFEQAPANFRWWMSQYEAQIHAAIQQGLPSASARRAPRRAPGRSDVPELVKTKWDQSTPYNNLLPSLGDGYTGSYALATGCVATAMAQVMYYHRCPAATGFGDHSYEGNFDLTFEADFGNTTYDWDNMLLKYNDGAYNTEEANAVATLMYHCGVSVDMEYNQICQGGSGANSLNIPHALCTYFGYDRSAQSVQRDYYTDDEWTDLVYSELQAGRPLLYGGDDAYGNGGHEFVCHGYKAADNTFAINWGWSGQQDGYFTLIGVDGLQPGGSGVGGAGEGASYTGSQDIVINVMPNKGTVETPLVMYCNTKDGRTVTLTNASGSTVTNPTIDLTQASQTSQTFKLSFYPWNFSGDTRTFETSLMFREAVTGATFYAANKTPARTLDHTYLVQQTVSFSSAEFEINGTYEVLPVVREAGETEWQRLRFPTSVTTPTVTITGGRSAEKTPINFAISGTTVEEHGTLTITHDKLYSGDITYSATPAGIVSIDDEGVVTALQAGTVTITATGEEDAYFLQTSKDFVVEVTPYVKKDIHFTISDTNVRINNTLTITHDAGSNYTGTISYTSTADAIATVDATGKVTGVAAGHATITATAPADELYNLSPQSFDIVVTADGIALLALNVPNNGYITMNRWDFSATVVNNTSTNWGKTYLKCNIPFGSQIVPVGAELSPFYAGQQATGVFDIYADYGTYIPSFFHIGDKVTTCVMDYDLNVISDDITFTFCNELSVEYTLTAAKWGTLCLPFEAEVPVGLTAYKVTGTNGSLLVKEEVDFLQMNTPYLVTGNSGKYTFTGPDTPTGSAWKAGLMVGNTAPSAYAPAGSYVLQLKDDVLGFYNVAKDDEQPVRQYTAYLQLPAGNNGLYYGIGSTNGIQQVGAIQAPAYGYQLNGVRVNGTAKGLTIQNGKIMFNKQ